MTGGPPPRGRDVTGGPPPRWGFCPGCERWRLTGAWGEPPGCPACGTAPDPLEQWSGGTGRIRLILELPPGGDLPLLG